MQFIKLSWRAPARATSYEVHYGAANDFAAATKYEEEPTGTALTVRGLADGTVYYFWVVAKNSGGSAMESNPHKAIRTSDDIPDFLKARLTPGGRVERYYATNLGWPDGDYYVVQDRGEDYLADERYYFGYANLGYGSGTIKYVWKFANPPEDPAVGKNQDRKPVYDLLWDINRGVIIYEFTDKLGATKYQATYYADEHVEPKAHIADHYGTGCHAPEAVMGQASGYNGVDSSNNDVTTDALDVAIAAFTSIGGPGQSGGRYAYWFMMQIYYAYRDPSIYPYD
jgi:hypothetical protein